MDRFLRDESFAMNKKVLVYCLLLTIVGCSNASSNAPDRRIVEGSVSYAGNPLADGMIRFVPVTGGPVATAIISDGKYKVDNKGGVPVGKVRVEITATSDEATLNQGLPDATPAKQVIIIPKKYNTESTLEETIADEPGQQVLDFTLTP